MTGTPKRQRLGRSSDLATRQIVYRTPQGIEVDELDHFEIIRKRVFYDDVLLVTYHRQQALGMVVFAVVLMLTFAILSVALSDEGAIAVWFAALAAIALIYAIARLSLRVDVVTVFGRRSKAAIRFVYRKALARRIFNEICAAATAAQNRLAEEIAASEPPPAEPVEELPPMPAEEAGPTSS